MLEWTIALIVLSCCALPAAMLIANWRAYRRPDDLSDEESVGPVSVLIPARNEQRAIANAVNSALASLRVELEVVVLDDDSTDQTATKVREIAALDSRVRLISAPSLPAGWCGKQHACQVLADAAKFDTLCWIDADVRLEPNGLARAARFLRQSNAGLVSGFPRQRTHSLGEDALIPLIHFLLLGYLPIYRMRQTASPAYGAGCGQIFLARREAYERAGGHRAIRATLHDGIALPRAFRRAGMMTDLFDATDVARCRMYRGFSQVWNGLGKNATEGMAAPAAIIPWTLLLAGHAAPWFVTPLTLFTNIVPHWGPTILWWIALLLSSATTGAIMLRFRQRLSSFPLHANGVVLLLAIQWWALARRVFGRPAQWKGRSYPQAA